MTQPPPPAGSGRSRENDHVVGMGYPVRNGKLATLIRLLGLALLGAVAYAWVDWRVFLATLSNVTVPAVAALLALATLDRLLMAAKWWQLSRGIGIPAPFREFAKIYYGASFLSYTMPSTLGAEVYRGWRMARFADAHRVVACMLMEKLVAVAATIALAWGGLLVLLLEFGNALTGPAVGILLGTSAIALAALALSLHPRTHDAMLWLPRRFGFAGPFEKLSRSYREFASRRALLWQNLLLAFGENATQLALLWACGAALGIEVDPRAFLAIIAVSQFARRASMVLDGWGLATTLHIVLFGLIGIEASQALAISLLSHAASAAACTPPGALVLLLDRGPRPAAGEL